jgi:hypothetical protein
MFVTPQVRGRDILAQLTMNLSLVTNVVVVVCVRARVLGVVILAQIAPKESNMQTILELFANSSL